MKTLIYLFIFSICMSAYGQDYYTIIKKNDDITYNYPKDAQITLIDENGNEKIINNEEAIDVTGDYTLSIVVPWSKKPEIIKSDGGRLEVFILSNIYANGYNKRKNKAYKKEISTYEESSSPQPYLTKKEITQKEKNGVYELLAVFSNGLIFKYSDGIAWAWINGDKVPVTNHYLVESPEGLLKLSFDPKDGEFWYVFDTSSKK
ncbi:hypothetical protein LX97_00744 [Nonlabens dokdonensis]|jgi:hypothetical protein|uniref:Secreted protein n=2 Tax=Nonlabens dokdonensis TaxID=328515 RepID=L7W7E4_NONDD|nr:hypothetical protein [Nonlabens dokdonensis]AGC76069.1 hypothetical protein DDD_0942 [Nonlabens dokdonensis DSW-6]PZX43741.1 hypothetical protein LX97_00744 [Nonlabens dokdonensis]